MPAQSISRRRLLALLLAVPATACSPLPAAAQTPSPQPRPVVPPSSAGQRRPSPLPPPGPPRTIDTAALLWFAKSMQYPRSVIETACRYSTLWLLGHNDLIGPSGPDWSSIDATIARIRSVKPGARIGLYVGGVMFKREIDPPALWLTDDDLLHTPDGSPLVLHDTAGTFSGGDPFTYCAPDLTDRAVVAKIVQGYVRFVRERQIQAILLDGYDADFYAALTRGVPADLSGMFGAKDGCKEGPLHRPDAWKGPLAYLGDQLRWYLEPLGVDFVFNGIHPGFDNASRLPHATGAMMEAIGVAYGDPAAFAGIVKTVNEAVGLGRRVTMSAMPWGHPTDSVDVRRYYLGLYLLCAAPGVSFGYSPYVPYRAWDGLDPSGHPSGSPAVFWSDDWDRAYGAPLAPAAAVGSCYGVPTAVWGRQFSHCVVLVNPAETHQQAIVDASSLYREWDPVSGPVLDQSVQAPYYLAWVAPRSARVLFKVRA